MVIVPNPLKIPYFVALDVDTSAEALALAKAIHPYVGGFKVGPRLLLRSGSDFLSELAARGPVFIDMKFHDIPSTMVAAVRAAFDVGASFVTVHASAGQEALQGLAEIERDLSAQRFFKVLVVTVLTSFTDSNLPSTWRKMPVLDHVQALASRTKEAGLTGLVCSAQEAPILREIFPESYLVTPGIRFPDEGQGDQKRVMGPQQALAAGASALVVGRPIVAAADPVKAAKSYYEATTGQQN